MYTATFSTYTPVFAMQSNLPFFGGVGVATAKAQRFVRATDTVVMSVAVAMLRFLLQNVA